MALASRKLFKATRIGKHHKATAPGEVRKLLEISEDDEIAWFLEESRIIIEKAHKGWKP